MLAGSAPLTTAWQSLQVNRNNTAHALPPPPRPWQQCTASRSLLTRHNNDAARSACTSPESKMLMFVLVFLSLSFSFWWRSRPGVFCSNSVGLGGQHAVDHPAVHVVSHSAPPPTPAVPQQPALWLPLPCLLCQSHHARSQTNAHAHRHPAIPTIPAITVLSSLSYAQHRAHSIPGLWSCLVVGLSGTQAHRSKTSGARREST